MSYGGPKDEWHCLCLALKDGHVDAGEAICQFKIQLNQYATPWQKLKWLLGFKPKFEFVNNYDGVNRGGSAVNN